MNRIILLILGCGAAFIIACGDKNPKTQKSHTPAISEKRNDTIPEKGFWVNGEIKPNQGMFQVLGDLGIDIPMALKLVNVLRFEVELSAMRAGEKVSARFDDDSTTILELLYQPDDVTDYKLTRDSLGEYHYSELRRLTEKKYSLVKGTIKEGSSLNNILLESGIPRNLTQVVNGILLCKISFRTDARAGDSFIVFLKEEYYREKWISGSVLYAAYKGRRTGFHEAYRYKEDDPKSSYNAHYTMKGEALVHSGLRYPVDRLHISSGYGMRRHPVTGRRSMHYGVDYSGSVGAPVYAVASGVVVSSNYDAYSGNKIAIRHRDRSISYYLHLSRRLVKTGQNVRSRQIIGKVGRTGRVTGPHLHFGFKNARGRWMNPLRKRMIATPRLAGKRLNALQAQVAVINRLKNDSEITLVLVDTLSSKPGAVTLQ